MRCHLLPAGVAEIRRRCEQNQLRPPLSCCGPSRPRAASSHLLARPACNWNCSGSGGRSSRCWCSCKADCDCKVAGSRAKAAGFADCGLWSKQRQQTATRAPESGRNLAASAEFKCVALQNCASVLIVASRAFCGVECAPPLGPALPLPLPLRAGARPSVARCQVAGQGPRSATFVKEAGTSRGPAGRTVVG